MAALTERLCDLTAASLVDWVIGVDSSVGMLARARTNLDGLGIDNIELREGDVPGEPKTTPTPRALPPARKTAPPRGPLAGHRVLILGGTHQHAAQVRVRSPPAAAQRR